VDQPGVKGNRDLAEMEAFAKRTTEFTEELQNESDRGALLIAANYLSGVLQELIKARMVVLTREQQNDLFEQSNGPLHPFSARIKLAHALGWIGPGMFKDLNLIRTIRNKFGAHSHFKMHFSALKQQCDAFNALKAVKWQSLVKPKTPRTQFFFAVNVLALQLDYLCAVSRTSSAGIDPEVEMMFLSPDGSLHDE
jgi:DNA-binding MltR family transcriptional regulator